MKEMDMDVTELKQITYISPRKHSEEHPVGLKGLREAEVPAREMKAVWEGLSTVGSQKEELCLKFSPPQPSTHTCHQPIPP